MEGSRRGRGREGRARPESRRRAPRPRGRRGGGVALGSSASRVRSADGSDELPLATCRHFADRDPLTRVVLERMLAGVSTRHYRRAQEPVGVQVEQRARSISKSSVSRAFVERTRRALGELMGRRLDDVRLAVMMLDGIQLKGRTNIVALGPTTKGVKIPLGLWEGSTENATVATALLSDPGRAWPRSRAGGGVRDRRRQGASQVGSGPPGPRTTTAAPVIGCERWPASSNAPTPAPPAHCAREWRRR